MIMRKECFEVCIKLNESQVWVCIGLISINQSKTLFKHGKIYSNLKYL